MSKEKKTLVLSSLVEGNSVRSTERITGVHRDTILRLLQGVAKKCEKISNSTIKNVHVRYLQVDEIWTFVQKKQKRVTPEEKGAEFLGDQYVFVGIDAETKFVPSYVVGKRDGRTAYLFMQNLNKRVANRFQLTTDAFKAYLDAVDFTFGINIDYAQLKKLYNGNGAGREGYSPSDINGTVPMPITGKPKLECISTSFVERQNLTMRMQMRRFTRLTNAFSKKLKNLKCALALHFFHYNFMRIHQTLRITPAMASGITDHIWSWDDLLAG
ncbi:MAG: IS1 family transposase [candidate division Zixibacteria bacterium]|nr:IS1 family transposase [candidate division Zixibacteria bacterium]